MMFVMLWLRDILITGKVFERRVDNNTSAENNEALNGHVICKIF